MAQRRIKQGFQIQTEDDTCSREDLVYDQASGYAALEAPAMNSISLPPPEPGNVDPRPDTNHRDLRRYYTRQPLREPLAAVIQRAEIVRGFRKKAKCVPVLCLSSGRPKRRPVGSH
jgi:hypothetical protein